MFPLLSRVEYPFSFLVMPSVETTVYYVRHTNISNIQPTGLVKIFDMKDIIVGRVFPPLRSRPCYTRTREMSWEQLAPGLFTFWKSVWLSLGCLTPHGG